ncbi:hypothetical protein HG530_000870 [Fusarium avenaceum]|nr:hypothetical protein HG530_000870 [Fusarium avenaceum]
MLQCARNVIRIAVVERARQVKVVQDAEKPLLLSVAGIGFKFGGRKGDEFSAFDLVYIMAPDHGNSALLGDKEHVIRPGELDKAEQAPGSATEFDATRTSVAIVYRVQQLVHLLEAVDNLVVGHIELGSLGGSVNLENPIPLLADINADNVISTGCFVQAELVHLVNQPIWHTVVEGIREGSCRRVGARRSHEGLRYSWLIVVVVLFNSGAARRFR